MQDYFLDKLNFLYAYKEKYFTRSIESGEFILANGGVVIKILKYFSNYDTFDKCIKERNIHIDDKNAMKVLRQILLGQSNGIDLFQAMKIIGEDICYFRIIMAAKMVLDKAHHYDV